MSRHRLKTKHNRFNLFLKESQGDSGGAFTPRDGCRTSNSYDTVARARGTVPSRLLLKATYPGQDRRFSLVPPHLYWYGTWLRNEHRSNPSHSAVARNLKPQKQTDRGRFCNVRLRHWRNLSKLHRALRKTLSISYADWYH